MSAVILGTELATWLRVGLWIALTFGIWLVWYCWFLARESGFLYAAVGAQLFSTAQIVLSVLAFGMAGLLYGGLLSAVNFVILGFIVWRGVWPHRKDLIRLHRELLAAVRTTRKSAVAIFILAAFLGITVWNLFWGWFLPVREWDGLAYHMPIAAAFHQSHAVYPIESTSVWIRNYPVNGELLETWNLALVGADKVVDWAFLPAVLGAVAAVYSLARRAGASPTRALLGTCVFAFAPAILMQQVGTLNDALFASWVAMGVFMAVGAPPAEGENRLARIWLSALGTAAGAGLLVGLKFGGAVYALGLIVLFAVRWLRPRGTDNPSLSGKQWLLVILSSAILFFGLGAYPYIRNWVTDGNPLAPFEIRIAGTLVWEGGKDISDFVDTTTEDIPESIGLLGRAVYVWFEPYGSVYDQRLGGLGPLWIAVGVPAALGWLILCLRRRRWTDLALIAVLTACFFLTPDYWYPRYVLSLLILGSIATAVVLENMAVWPRRVIQAEILFLGLFSGFNVLAPYRLTSGDAVAMVRAEDDRTRSSPQFLTTEEGKKAYEWIDRYTLDHPSVILYGKRLTFPYALYGTDFRNRVITMRPSSEEDWLGTLEQEQVNLAVVLDFTPNYEWTAADADFQEVFRDERIVIFQRIP